MPNQLRNLTVEFVSLVDRAAVRDPSNPTEPQTFLLWKAERGPATTNGGDMPDTPTAEELTAALKKAEEERDAAVERAEKAETELTKKDEPAASKIDKSELPAEVREALEKSERDAAETRERLEKAEQLAKAERDARIEREFISKAESEFPHLGKADELGPRLKRMSETLSKDDFDAHVEELVRANAQIETGALFAELGKSGDPTPEGSGSGQITELTRKAEEIRKADPNVSEYEAMRRALQTDKTTQARYLGGAR